MKVFFVKLGFFVLLTVALVAWEWHRTEHEIAALGPETRGSVELLAKIIILTRAVPNARVIMGGDSKAERQLVPAVFDEAGVPAINIGVPSGDLWSLVRNLELLGLDQYPATFLISVGSYQINDGNNQKDAISAEQYFNYTPKERMSMFKGAYFAAARTMLKKADLYRQHMAFASAIARGGHFPDFGFLAVDPSDFTCVRFRHGSQVSPWPSYRDIKTDGARWRLFREAVHKISGWRGRFVLFNPPFTKKGHACMAGTYGEDLEREFSRKVDELIRPLTNVKFVDLFWNSRWSDSDFYDPGHLNKFGAVKFTRWWLDYLKGVGWL